jgi:hypothetical protein
VLEVESGVVQMLIATAIGDDKVDWPDPASSDLR